MQRGVLRSVKLGGRRLIPRDALHELLAQRDVSGIAAERGAGDA